MKTRLLLISALFLAAITAPAAPIHDAARKLDVAEVRRLLDTGTDVNAKNTAKYKEGETPLMNAVLPYGKETEREGKGFSVFIREWLFEDNLEIVRLLLERGADVNATDKDGSTALMNAVWHYSMAKSKQKPLRLDVVRMLLDKGADVNAKSKNNDPALMRAASCGPDMLRLLLEHGAEVNVKDEYGNSALSGALGRGLTEEARLLLKHGAVMDARAFNSAIGSHNREAVSFALENGADLSAAGGEPPLHKAVEEAKSSALGILSYNPEKDKAADLERYKANREQDLKIIRLLLEKGAPTATVDQRNKTALECAIEACDSEVVAILLEKMGDGNKLLLHQAVEAAKRSAFGISTYNPEKDKAADLERYKANREQDLKIIRLLLEKGAPTTAVDRSDKTALECAIEACDSEVVAILLEKMGDINVRNKDGQSPLMLSINNAAQSLKMRRYYTEKNDQKLAAYSQSKREDCLRVVEGLLAKGADVNARDKDGKSPLYQAIYENDDELAKWLLDKGADADAKGPKNPFDEPLLFCVARDFSKSLETTKWLRLLLEKGGDVNAKNADGRTVLLYEIIVLRDEMGMISYYEKKGDSKAAKKQRDVCASRVETIKFLLEKGADVNAKDKDGDFPLREAVVSVNMEVVKLLLEKKPDIDAPDKDGWTPLMRAVSDDRCPNEIITLLLNHGADPTFKTEKPGYSALELARNAKYLQRLELMETKMCEHLEYAVKAVSVDNPKITDALIATQSSQLPNFLATATTEQKVALLTTVNQQIAKAKVRMGELNEQGRAAISKGKDGADFRRRALQVSAYMDVLKEIKTILEGS